jgi:hypothetical protein
MKKAVMKNAVIKNAAWLFIITLWITQGQMVSAQDHLAQFLETSGTVEIQEPGSSLWTPAAAGMTLTRNTVISTGFRSTAVVALADSTLSIRPLTRLTLEEILQQENNTEVRLYLQSGRVRADVAPPSGGQTDFSVRSPTVTASVRGTAFEFDTLHLIVENGRVRYIGANGQSLSVDQGEQSYIDETENRLIPPFEIAHTLLTPRLPELTETGGTTTSAPVIGPDPLGGIGVGVEWP